MADTAENVLYVILHGLMGLVDIGNAGFDAYMFDMSTDHRYLFGSWLIESDSVEQNHTPLVLTLDSVIPGVRDATNVLNPDVNLVIQLKAPLPPNLPGTRAVIHLPRPRRIYYYTCGDARKIIDGDKSQLVNGVFPSFISETRVFEYSFSGSQTPQLLAGDPPSGSPLWQCPKDLAQAGFRQVATLHFYNEPDTSDPNTAEQHARAEFLLSTAILGVPIKLIQASPANFLEPPGSTQPNFKALGILQQEVTPLDGRNGALLDLQYLARSGQQRPDDGSGGGGGPICGGGNAQV